jgi:hypothetical protein
MADNREQRILSMASEVCDLLCGKLNPYEADTACAIAKELTAMKVKAACFLHTSTEPLPE